MSRRYLLQKEEEGSTQKVRALFLVMFTLHYFTVSNFISFDLSSNIVCGHVFKGLEYQSKKEETAATPKRGAGRQYHAKGAGHLGPSGALLWPGFFWALSGVVVDLSWSSWSSSVLCSIVLSPLGASLHAMS